MSDRSETKGGLRRGRRAAFAVSIVAALTLTAPLGAAGEGISAEPDAAAFRASAEAAGLPVDIAVLAPPIAAAASARAEVAPSFVNDVLGLLDRTLGALFNWLGGAVRTTPASPTASSTSTSTSTSTTTTLACRNSANPACGPFRFDPQPAPDRPMTVHVVAEPATVPVGQPMVFRLTLVDPDGVSHRATSVFFGDDIGQGASSINSCEKYGPWDPPAPDPSRSLEVREVAHTYSEAGTFTASFDFRAEPFDCVDSVTGRGDRPYASSARGSVTVVVTP